MALIRCDQGASKKVKVSGSGDLYCNFLMVNDVYKGGYQATSITLDGYTIDRPTATGGIYLTAPVDSDVEFYVGPNDGTGTSSTKYTCHVPANTRTQITASGVGSGTIIFYIYE